MNEMVEQVRALGPIRIEVPDEEFDRPAEVVEVTA
jgi:hypothetical protein